MLLATDEEVGSSSNRQTRREAGAQSQGARSGGTRHRQMSQPSHRKEPHHATSSTASRTRRSALSGLLLVSLVATMFVIQGTGSARADGTVHYVSTNGSDSNPGTIDHPWRTIAHSLVSLRAGDILNIRGGTYVERIMSPSLARGTDLARIRVQNYPNERPVLQGLLWISGAYDWTFSGLNVTWDPARNNRYEHMVKFTNGVGWVFKNAEVWGAHSYAAILGAVRDLDVLRVKRQVSRRAASQLEDPSTGLRADPSPPVAEQDALEEGDLAVVT